MSLPEPDERPAGSVAQIRPHDAGARRRRGYVGGVLLLVLIAIVLRATLGGPSGGGGIAPGQKLPPFAAPLALSNLSGDADIANHGNEGSAGLVPACRERGPRILNVCALWESGPLVLAFFINAGACPRILSEMQALAPAFPGVRFAAVAIGEDRSSVRRLIGADGIGFPVGMDGDGAVATLYRVAGCPQVNFIYPGGKAQGPILSTLPAPGLLRARVAELAAAARGRESGAASG